jgi:hypothetical protein
MPYTKREMLLSPPSGDGMQITGTNTTSQNLNVNIIVAKWLGRELIEVELRPFLRVLDLEALECVWINHGVFIKGRNVQYFQLEL